MHTGHIATAIAPRTPDFAVTRRGRPAEQRADAVVAAAPKVGSASPGTCQVTRTSRSPLPITLSRSQQSYNDNMAETGMAALESDAPKRTFAAYSELRYSCRAARGVLQHRVQARTLIATFRAGHTDASEWACSWA